MNETKVFANQQKDLYKSQNKRYILTGKAFYINSYYIKYGYSIHSYRVV